MSTTELASDPVTVHQLLSADNELRCPLFQRPYVWAKKNIDQLWADIDTVRDGECEVRFLGALVFNNEYASSSKKAGLFWIIDGQQRLTTLYLSLIALAEVAEEAGDSSTRNSLLNEYLISRKADNKNQPKLKPTLTDTRQFNKLLTAAFGESVETDSSHEYGPVEGNMREAYQIILEHVRSRCSNDNNEVVPKLVGDLRTTILEHLEFVEIRLGNKHDPNEVFDRLNKEGMKLGIIDLIRNEVLKRLKDKASTAISLFEKHWKPFEQSFSDEYQRDGYFFPFALTRNSSVTKSKTFSSLTKRWSEFSENEDDPIKQIKKIMSDLSEHVSTYNALVSGTSVPKLTAAVSNQLLKLHRMKCPTVTYPYIFKLISAVQNSKCTETEAVESLQLVESFLVRRGFVGLEPTGLHAVFKGLWDEAQASKEKLRAKLETTTIKFPGDAEFSSAIREAPLYRRRIRNYVIEEYERSFTKGDVLKTFPSITVDHILPQSPTGEWLAKINDDDREKWTDTWANLVPLSQKANSEKGQSSWKDTREKLSNETVFSTTKHIYDEYTDWNVKSLRKRADKLVDWALDRWPSST